ncbi:hypothetical protein ACFL5V_06670 [Fibrobacterota bacterium]
MDVQSAKLFPGAQQQPLDYPGRRPDYSYLYYREKVYEIWAEGKSYTEVRIKGPEGEIPLDDFLVMQGSSPLEKRNAVLSVGSNGCPGRLVEKFGGHPEARHSAILADTDLWNRLTEFLDRNMSFLKTDENGHLTP